MQESIGSAAGKIWEYLSNNAEVTIASLKKGLEIKSDEITMALGWLAREDKIEFIKKGAGFKIKLR